MIQKHCDSNWLAQIKRHTIRRVLSLKLPEAVKRVWNELWFKKVLEIKQQTGPL